MPIESNNFEERRGTALRIAKWLALLATLVGAGLGGWRGWDVPDAAGDVAIERPIDQLLSSFGTTDRMAYALTWSLLGGALGLLLAVPPFAVFIVLALRESLEVSRRRTRSRLANEMQAVIRRQSDGRSTN